MLGTGLGQWILPTAGSEEAIRGVLANDHGPGKIEDATMSNLFMDTDGYLEEGAEIARLMALGAA